MGWRSVVVAFLMVVVVMSGGKLDIHGAEKSEDDRLQQADQKLHEVEGEGDQDAADHAPGLASLVEKAAEGVKHALTGEDVAVESDGEGHRTQEDGDDFNDTHEEEHCADHQTHDAFKTTLRAEGMDDEAPDTDFLDGQ